MSSQSQRENRRLPKCVTPAQPDTCDVLSKVLRIANPCDPQRPDPCILAGFEFPAALPPAPDSGPGAMQTIAVGNDLTSGTCGGADYPSANRPGSTNEEPCSDPDNPGVGATSVTVAADTYVFAVSLTVIPSLSDEDRKRIIALGDLQALESASVPTIVTTLLVSEAQAQVLRDALDDAKLNVDALAAGEVNATLLSSCTWYNAELVSLCPSGQKPDAPYLTVPCGTYASQVSQVAADDQAQAYIDQNKTCYWVNAEVTVSCDPGFSPSRTVPSTGTVTVLAGAVRSDVSQADADAQALAYAESQLTCVYGNANPHQCICTEPGQINGSPIIAAQTVFSSVSVADADALAEALALQNCDCYWCSASVSSSCPNQKVWYSPAQDAFKLANPDGTNSTGDPCAESAIIAPWTAEGSTTGACAYRSYVSQADADAQAAAATPLAVCTYANCGIGPRCAPTGGVESVGCVDFSEEIGPGVFVSADAVSACNQALAISKLPSRFRPSYANGEVGTYVQPRNIRCCYESQETTVTCADESTRLPSLDPDVYDPDETWCPPTPIPEDAIGKYDGMDAALGLTDASRGRFITLPSASITKCNLYTYAPDCSFTVAGPPPEDYWRGDECGTGPVGGYASQTMVDTLARDNAMGALTCEFASQPAEVFCDFTANPSTGEITNTGAATAGNFDPDAVGSTSHAIVVEKGQFISYSSLAEANLIRNTYLSSLRDCFYSNAQVNLLCMSAADSAAFIATDYATLYSGVINAGNDQVTLGQPVFADSKRGFVDARTFRSYISQISSNRMAQREAVAQLDCFYLNALLTMKCDTAVAVDAWKVASYTNQTTLNLGSGFVYGTQPVDVLASGSTPRPVSVLAGAFISRTSQVLANRAAVLVGISLLDCYYSNGDISMKCASSGIIAGWIASDYTTPESTLIALGNAEVQVGYKVYQESSGADGRPVLLPLRTTRSYVSQQAANRQAITIASTLLDCYYVNPKTDIYCGDYSRAYMEAIVPPLPADSDTAATTVTIDGRPEVMPVYYPGDCPSLVIPVTVPDVLLPEVGHAGALAYSLPAKVLRDYTSWTNVNTVAQQLAKVSATCTYPNSDQWCNCSWSYASAGTITMAYSGSMGALLPNKSVFSTVSSVAAQEQGEALRNELWELRMDIEGTDCAGNTRDQIANSIKVVNRTLGCFSSLETKGLTVTRSGGEQSKLGGGSLTLSSIAGGNALSLDAKCLASPAGGGASVTLKAYRTCFTVPVRHVIKVNGHTSTDLDPLTGEWPETTTDSVTGGGGGDGTPTEAPCPCDLVNKTVQSVSLVTFYKYLCITGVTDASTGCGGSEFGPTGLTPTAAGTTACNNLCPTDATLDCT